MGFKIENVFYLNNRTMILYFKNLANLQKILAKNRLFSNFV